MNRQRRLLRRLPFALVLVLATIACGARETAYDGPLLRLATAGNVVGALATAVRDDHIAIAWFEAIGPDTAVFVSRSLDGGNSFSIGLRVSPPGERTMHRVDEAPGVELILDPDGFAQPFLAWTRTFADSSAIVWSYTKDGTAYSKPAVIPGSAGRGARALRALVRDSTDRVFATWDAQDSREATGTNAAWRGSTDGGVPARQLDGTAASHGLADPSRPQTLRVGIADGSLLRVWSDSTSAPGTLRVQRMHVDSSGGSELASPIVTLGAGAGPVLAFPGTGPVLIWISHRATGREINVIPLR